MKKINIKGKIFGGESFLICLPLISKTKKELIKDAKELIKLNPDVIEWRVDYFDNLDYQNESELIISMKELYYLTKNIPVIFTCRLFDEGGNKKIKQIDRIKIIEQALRFNLADIVDIEMINEKMFLEEVKALVKKYEKKLILSHHNFFETPNEKFILNKLMEGKKMGADITKLAVMANSYGDALKLFNATYKAKNFHVDIPIIAISMGDYGKITRVFGGFFGSDMGFAVGKELSAPGQLSIEKIRKIFTIMNENNKKKEKS